MTVENTPQARLVRLVAAVSGYRQSDIEDVRGVRSKLFREVRADFIYEIKFKGDGDKPPMPAMPLWFLEEIDDGQPPLE